MHHANHFYGHANIMATYAGLPKPPRIWGYLQHGWNILDGFAHGTNFAPECRSSSGPTASVVAGTRSVCGTTR